MPSRFDRVAKGIGEKALGPLGTTIIQDTINPETQYADLRHEPDPARHEERARIGLLGELTARACIVEAYSSAPRAPEFRACLTKHLASWKRRVRNARSESRKRNEPEPDEESLASELWIIAAGAPTTLLTKLKFERSLRWPAGVYLFGDDVLRVGIVVASELPRDRKTLLLRLMAAGPLLGSAVQEVMALPEDAYERTVAEPCLVDFLKVVEQSPSEDPHEKEFVMVMSKSWEQGKVEARTEGRAEGQANAVLTVLHVRGIAVPDAERERILAQRDPEQLTRWLEKAIVASSLREVLGDLS